MHLVFTATMSLRGGNCCFCFCLQASISPTLSTWGNHCMISAWVYSPGRAAILGTLSSSGKELDKYVMIDPLDALSPTWILNKMTQKDLKPFLLYSSGWHSPEKTCYNFCNLDLISCSETCPFPCGVLQIFSLNPWDFVPLK